MHAIESCGSTISYRASAMVVREAAVRRPTVVELREPDKAPPNTTNPPHDQTRAPSLGLFEVGERGRESASRLPWPGPSSVGFRSLEPLARFGPFGEYMLYARHVCGRHAPRRRVSHWASQAATVWEDPRCHSAGLPQLYFESRRPSPLPGFVTR
jgi:hypothetical protein